MNKTKQKLAALTVATALISPVFASEISLASPATVNAATTQQQPEFTPKMPQSGFQLNKNQKVKIPVMITNNTNKTRIYRISPVNVITNDSLTTQYAKDKPGNSIYLSDLITDKTVKVAPHKTGRVFFNVTAPKQNNLIYGGLLIQADNQPEQGQTLPFDIQVGPMPKLQMTATAANFVRNTQYPALKVSYQSNGVIMQNTKIDSQLMLGNKVVAETKTDKRDIAPNSTANLSLLIKQKLEPGNYNIRTTFDNGKNQQTVNTPMKLNAKQLKPANAMIVDQAKAQQKSSPLKGVLIAIVAIILSAVIGAGGTILYYKKIKHPDLQTGDGERPKDDSELKPDSDFPDPVYPDEAPKKKSHFKLFHKKHKEEIPDSFNQGQEPENPLINPDDDKKDNAINADLTFKPHYQKVPDVKSEKKHDDSIIVSDQKPEQKDSAVNQVNKGNTGSSIQLGMDNGSKNNDVSDSKPVSGMQSSNSDSEKKSENNVSGENAKSDQNSGKISIDNKRALKDLQDMLK